MPKSLRDRDGEKAAPEPIKFRFNKRLIESLALPTAERAYYYDDVTPGLAICITGAGSRTFYCCYRADGRYIRYRIGGFPGVTVEQARDRAKELTGEVAKGSDPQRTKHDRRAELSFGELMTAYLDNHVRPKRKAATASEYSRLNDKLLAGWKGKPISAVKRQDVAALHLRIGEENGRYAANRVLSLVHAVYEYAIAQQYYDKANPAAGIERFAETKRDRFLQSDELPKFFQAVDGEPDQTLKDFFVLLLLTGARRSNVQAMRWEEISWSRLEWRIPSTKSGDVVVVPLMATAVEILERRRDEGDGTPWVFPSYGKSGHITEPKAAWKKLLERAGLRDLRLHDLRRSHGSWMAISGASLPIIGKALGHRSTASTGVYARLSQDPVREAMEKATGAMLAAGKSKGGE